MKPHTKIYLDYFGYSGDTYVPCEICKDPAVDVHHIEPRGMGGSKVKDYIENLMGLCRDCHRKCESGEITRAEQMRIHSSYMKRYGKKSSYN